MKKPLGCIGEDSTEVNSNSQACAHPLAGRAGGHQPSAKQGPFLMHNQRQHPPAIPPEAWHAVLVGTPTEEVNVFPGLQAAGMGDGTAYSKRGTMCAAKVREARWRPLFRASVWISCDPQGAEIAKHHIECFKRSVPCFLPHHTNAHFKLFRVQVCNPQQRRRRAIRECAQHERRRVAAPRPARRCRRCAVAPQGRHQGVPGCCGKG